MEYADSGDMTKDLQEKVDDGWYVTNFAQNEPGEKVPQFIVTYEKHYKKE
jgi:hypothetical protein